MLILDSGISKVAKETDSQAVELTKILIKLMRLVKLCNNVLTMTKEGEKVAANDELLMKTLMVILCCEFNKNYWDGFESEDIGNVGGGFTLLLLHKYGSEKRLDSFYVDRYFRAFPKLSNDLPPSEALSCYSIRTFDRLLLHLGLIEVEGEGYLAREKDIIKTELFDKLISVVPPRNM
ncbi:hypothetical protein [Bacteroides reticulotermitis]|uniref:Uncharacterized protein n=2 Tax=Bacteroides reticulotermitis TaxID=1133319 RepID=W4UV55_9BACE|nr:hypothetical protein [Bacteroides reticulotermitis]MBB4045627.1 hypothetical protein [Bacteroides reticulotermitis]GAE84394.1 hypothetical protein JCM10512_2736 [Bacteroides reticulotermitis JCM 10512]